MIKVEKISIHPLSEADIPNLVTDFAAHNWPKPQSLFNEYLKEQQNNKRLIWVAYTDQQVAGYITLKWESQYEPFHKDHIPEIMDLNVLPPFRKIGIGSKLLEVAENEAATKGDTIGIGVGLYNAPDGGYGPAQKLYIRHGYLPNGLGLSYQYKILEYGDKAILDDDLVLWFTKKLK